VLDRQRRTIQIGLGGESRRGHAAPPLDECGMLPDPRFAIGAVLASALLIVAAFGLAATIRVAHHRTAMPDDPSRMVADPADWGLHADRSRPTTVAEIVVPEALLPDRLAASEAQTAEIGDRPAVSDTPPATIEPNAPIAVSTDPAAAPPETAPEPVDVVAAIPRPVLAPVEATATPPAIEIPNAEFEPLKPSERVGTLPGFPTAGPGFVPLPPKHPVALPVPDPRGVATKKPTKKKAVRRRYRLWPLLPFANTRYPVNRYQKWTVD
jgi:hypothetical protein